jgi:hypothetical protein
MKALQKKGMNSEQAKANIEPFKANYITLLTPPVIISFLCGQL